MNGQPVAVLNNGVEIPQLGFRVLQLPPDQTAGIVERALQIGYRHIDTAARYGNEAGVAEGIRRSGLPREELFITTKLPNDRHGRRLVTGALEESLNRLRLDHLDLYLIHWPLPIQDLYAETWQGMEDMRAQGKARAIGVSTAWGPLGRGQYPLLEDADVRAIAREQGKTPAQVVIRWHMQKGNIIFPKSGHEARLRENFAVFHFSLSPGQMATIDQLDADRRIGPDPAEFTG